DQRIETSEREEEHHRDDHHVARTLEQRGNDDQSDKEREKQTRLRGAEERADHEFEQAGRRQRGIENRLRREAMSAFDFRSNLSVRDELRQRDQNGDGQGGPELRS